MVPIDLKKLIARLSTAGTRCMEAAVGQCVSRTHYEVTVEHFVLQCGRDTGSDFFRALQYFGVETERLERALSSALEAYRTGNTAKPVFSPRLIELLQDAWSYASLEMGESVIRTGAVLRVLVDRPNLFGAGGWTDVLAGVKRDALAAEFGTATAGSSESGGTVVQGPASKGGDGYIERFCVDLSRKAAEGGVDPVFGRDEEIRRMVDILSRRRKNNPILVGEPGVGKTAVVEGLARRIVEGDVPQALAGVRLLELDVGLLEAGASVKGEFENRLKGVIAEVTSSEQPVIVFIDEAHRLVGGMGSNDAANLLKPALARGELRTIAATTWAEYKKYFEKDPALARRFQPVKLDEPSVDAAILILRGLKDHYEQSHGVVVRDDAVETAVRYADRYITGRFLPDKAIDLLDTSCARVKVSLSSKPPALEDLERRLQALEREECALQRDRMHGVAIDADRIDDVTRSIAETKEQVCTTADLWQTQKAAAEEVLQLRKRAGESIGVEQEGCGRFEESLEAAGRELRELQGTAPMVHIEVCPDVVAQVVSDWTGIPVGRFLRDEATLIMSLEERLRERIKGQDQAVDILARTVKASKAGLGGPDRPLGVFLLVGPSGTGKTETGRALAELLFGSDGHMITLNMSEFQESHTVSRLVGSPPGYVGYGEGGMLTEAVRRKPYSVVLLDEVEKASLDVMEAFYQVFDKGVMTDGEGKEVSFRNTIILMTSNLGSEVILRMTTQGAAPDGEQIVETIRPILSDHFKPALLGRMTIVPYTGLNDEAMRMIIVQKIDRIRQALAAGSGIALQVNEAVVDAVAARCTDRESGARAVDTILEGRVFPRLSQEILARMVDREMPASVSVDVGSSGAFEVTFSE